MSYEILQNSTYCQSLVSEANVTFPASGTFFGVNGLAAIIVIIGFLWVALALGYVTIRKRLYKDKVKVMFYNNLWHTKSN